MSLQSSILYHDGTIIGCEIWDTAEFDPVWDSHSHTMHEAVDTVM